jgi:imidazolonepropionase
VSPARTGAGRPRSERSRPAHSTPAAWDGAASLSFVGATQLLRPPEDGLEYVRGGQAGGLTLEPGALTARDGCIAALEHDPGTDLVVDARGCALLPGLIDCHTHLPFAGWRASEYERRVGGAAYEEIARAGGGIAASARSLHETDDEGVLTQARAMALEMLAAGTTTFECKSGYGLSREGELRALRLAAELQQTVEQTTTSTALLAHAVPDGHSADSWMDEVEAMLPTVLEQGNVSALDIFVESIAFSNQHLQRMGALAERAGLALRCHVEQLATNRSVPVALAAGARSVDHLSQLHPDDVAPLAAARCAAVLLPAAEFLNAERRAPARALLDAGAIVVLSTDANPGTSPVLSLPLVIGLGVRMYGLSTREALAATTHNAAWTLGLAGDRGSLEPGKRADLVLLDSPADHIAYRFGRNPVAATFIAGRPAYVRPDAAWRVRIA